MLFRQIAAIAIATVVSADQSFTLTANGEGINSPVTKGSGDFLLSIDNGDQATFVLGEPDGYLTVDGKYLRSFRDGVTAVEDKSHASHPWGLENGNLRMNLDSNWFACKEETGYKINSWKERDNCTPVKLTANGAVTSSVVSSIDSKSTEPESTDSDDLTDRDVSTETDVSKQPEEPSESVQTFTATNTRTDVVTITSCGPDVTGCPGNGTIPPYEGAGHKIRTGGSLMFMILALLA